MIWTPRKKLIVPLRQPIVLPLRFGVSGEYRIEAVRPDGTRRLLADWFPNLIVDVGLDAIGANASLGGPPFIGWCRVGTGTDLPAVGNTALQAQVASTASLVASTDTNSGSVPYFAESTRTYQFGVGAAAGNLAEVGVGSGSTGPNLFSRARILDVNGNPTTITVLSDEFLNVSYRLRQYPPAADRLGEFFIGSAAYTYTARASQANSWLLSSSAWNGGSPSVSVFSGAIGSITSLPSGSSLGNGTVTVAAYTAGNFYRDLSAVWEPNNGNGTHRSYRVNVGIPGTYQYEISPTIVKTNLDQLTMSFRIGWQRIVGTG
jgi:hypothetical protein